MNFDFRSQFQNFVFQISPSCQLKLAITYKYRLTPSKKYLDKICKKYVPAHSWRRRNIQQLKSRDRIYRSEKMLIKFKSNEYWKNTLIHIKCTQPHHAHQVSILVLHNQSRVVNLTIKLHTMYLNSTSNISAFFLDLKQF